MVWALSGTEWTSFYVYCIAMMITAEELLTIEVLSFPFRIQIKMKLNSIFSLCESQRLEPAWNELANTLSYDPSVSISRIDCTQHRPICQDFEVKGYPTLLWIVDGKKEEKYSGSRSVEAFKEFIEQKTASERKHAIDEEEAKVQEIAVLQLTGGSFNHGIEKGVTIVSGHSVCQPFCLVKLDILIYSHLLLGEILRSMVSA